MEHSEAVRSCSPGFERPNMRDLRIVLLGKNLSEKNKVGNLILGTDVFKSEAPSDETFHQHSEKVSGTVMDRHVIIINSPQVLQPYLSFCDIKQAVKECMNLSAPGPHVFILVLQYNDFNDLNGHRVKYVLKEFSGEAIKRTIVITTDEETYRSMFSYMNKNKAIHQLMKECGGGHLQFDERKPELQSKIFRRVDKILKENLKEYLPYEINEGIKRRSVVEEQIGSCDLVRSEEENKEQSQKDDGKPKKGKKDRNNEASANASRKEKLNLVLCGSDTTLTVSVSQILQGKKIKPSHQSVCSVDVELHGRLISLVKLPALNQLSEEEVRRQTLHCVSHCDPGVHVFIIIIPVAPLNNEDKSEIEKIQKIFDSREHFMVLFITGMTVEEPVINFAKSMFDSQSLCGGRYRVMGLKEPENSRQIPELLEYIENMKTEPYSLQMYVKAQENRARHETEEKYQEELQRMQNKIKELQLKIPSEGAEGEADDQECLRIVLIGRTGSGKSATGNTILGRDEFHSELSADSVTTVCKKRVGEIYGKSVAVVDTLGLFDTTLSNKLAVDEVGKCVSMISPGPHVFAIVLSLGRFTKEETDTVDLIKKIFGPKAAQFSIVLFTRGDELQNESIQDYVKRSKSAELQKLIRDCGNRFLVFNNKEKQDKTQVIQLLTMIEEVKNSNQGQYFTNSMFEEAEMSIKKRMEEILKEKEREIQAQKEELQARHEMDMKNMIKRLEEEKQRADEEKMKIENRFRENEGKLRKEFEAKEKTEQKKQEIENQKQSVQEKQQKAEYHKKIEEMRREIENQRSQYEKQQKEREEEDRKREEKYRQIHQEKMKHEQERIIAELQTKQEKEIKKRDLEEKWRNEEEEKERQEWKRKIKVSENEKKEGIKQQQRKWEDEKKRQMRVREEEERKRKEKHEEQLREKQEEQEKIKKTFEREREEDRQKIEEERQKERRKREEKEREYEEKKLETKRYYDQLEQRRKEEWVRRKQEDEERREEERKRSKKMIEDLKREQEEEMKRREEERKKREEKERDEMKQKYEEEKKEIKKKHEDEARKQAEELNDFRERKEQQVQELQQMLDEHKRQQELLEKLHQHLKDHKEKEIKELIKEVEKLKKKPGCVIM